jgi:methylenetetrahydrofolate reductase (NADPH)
MDYCIGVAGYPEKHFEAPNLKSDIEYLKEKVDAGAEYIVTQMFFDNNKYFDFVNKCRRAKIDVPIIPGLKVLSSIKQLKSIPKKFYIDFPNELVEEATNNSEHISEIGKEWTIKQCEELLNEGVPSIHFYIMNKVIPILEIINKLK